MRTGSQAVQQAKQPSMGGGASGKSPAYFCTSWGLGQKGQLCTTQMSNQQDAISNLNAIQIPPIDSQENFLQVACGENHTLVLTDSLQLASCGSNTYGQLGGVLPQNQADYKQQQNQANAGAAASVPNDFIRQLQRLHVSAEGSTIAAVNAVGQSSQQTQNLQFDSISCGAENAFALTTDGELYSWGLNFKGQLGLGDFENRSDPTLIDSFMIGVAPPSTGSRNQVQTSDSAVSGPQTKKYLLNMLKRSKSKEQQLNNGSRTQRIVSGGIQNSVGGGTQTSNQPSGASKSIFNQSYKDLKPSKSVDLSSSALQAGADHASTDILEELEGVFSGGASYDLYVFKPSEKVEQVSCGSIHSLLRTNQHRIFSCGNGSTFALGHPSRQSCSTFKQIEFFNSPYSHSLQQNSENNVPSTVNSTTTTGLNNIQFKSIACGLSHSGCVTSTGQVFVWGLTGDVKSFSASQEKLIEKCLLKTPTKISFKQCLERDTTASSSVTKRRASGNESGSQMQAGYANPEIEDLQMGEYFCLALSQRGYVYSWGMNDKGQLGVKTENQPMAFEPIAVSSSKSTLSKAVQRIECGLKHCMVLTKDYQLYSWGSNQFSQLGVKLPAGQEFSTIPVHVRAFEKSKPFKMVCGSYHNICFSYRLPALEDPESSLEKPLAESKVAKVAEEKKTGNHEEESQYVAQIAKLQGVIKRLRQELIMKGTSKKEKQRQMYDSEDDDSYGTELDEEEKAALNMLSPEQRKMFIELEKAGANPKYLKKKLKQVLQQQSQGGQANFFSNEARAFVVNNEIPFEDITYDKKISEGGYGIVYKGKWKHTVVAIKEIKREIIEQDKLEEFKNECAVMEVIRHPNVVLFLGSCTKSPNLCIVLEYCPRGSLWGLLHDLQIKITWEHRKKFALDIAKGVYYLHTSKQPILHRDLKSLNILLDHALTCKLADFGWTRIKAKVMTSKIGTYQWMAPEVIRGFKYTEKADVFSFGVICWELATRKPPYYGIDGQVVSQKVVREGLRPKISEREAPGAFLDLMRRCWDDSPDKRPNFGSIIRDLDQMNFKGL